MKRRVSLVKWSTTLTSTLACAVAIAGCTCGSKSQQTTATASAASFAPSTSTSSALVPLGAMTDATSAASYSNPIAAARIANGTIVVAGLFASGSSILLTGFRASGLPEWTAEAFHGVAWSADAELRVLAAGDGAAVIWRGAVGDKVARFMTVVGPRGEARGPAIEVGSGLCATADGVAWIDRNGVEPVRVRSRS